MTDWCSPNCDYFMYVAEDEVLLCYTNQFEINTMPLFKYKVSIVILGLINPYIMSVRMTDHGNVLL